METYRATSTSSEGVAGYHARTVHRAVVTTAQVEAADDFVLGFGAPKAVCCGRPGGAPGVYEIRLPPGMAGRFTVEQVKPPPSNYNVEAAIYDWSTGAWRPLAATPFDRAFPKPIADSEINDGLVRIRAGIHVPDPGLRVVRAHPGT